MNIGKEKLKNILMKKYDAKLQYNGVWYNISCPFCGDSPNPKTRHCNIRISDEDNVVIVHCFQLKCHASGIMNRKHLNQMGIYDRDVIDFVQSNTASSQELMRRQSNVVQDFRLPLSLPQDICDYYHKRTRKFLDSESISRFRIVTSLEEFISINELPRGVETRIRKLKSSYIGFLNHTATNLELRSIDKDIPKDQRFLKISLIEGNDMLRFSKHKPYLIERNNDYDLEDKGYIVICEGKFDLINTFNILMPECNGIFISSTVGGFQSIIEEYSKLYPYRNLVIVADKDVTDVNIRRMIGDLWYRFNKVYVIRNEASKDVGDMSEPLKPYKYEIKGGQR